MLVHLLPLHLLGMTAVPPSGVNEKVYDHMASQFSTGFAMFQHFGVNTFAHVEHNCIGAPKGKCLSPAMFDPTDLNATQWMEVDMYIPCMPHGCPVELMCA